MTKSNRLALALACAAIVAFGVSAGALAEDSQI